MKRKAYDDLIEWKNSEHHKPLIIKGARQTGKTWLMKAFGKGEYQNTAYFNFENNQRLRQIFKENLDIGQIITSLQIESSQNIVPGETLIIFDEIQEVPSAITSLKYFQEEAPSHHIIAAGSLLGVAMHPEASFPVGKISFLQLNPFTFSEFLNAMGENELNELMENGEWKIVSAFSSKLIHLLKHYYFTGGMPEVVANYVQHQNFSECRTIQNNILQTYEQDFSKHAPLEIVPRLRMVWNAIPAQLAKENRKFIYGQLKKGGRAKEFELAIQWLADAGLIHKIHRVSKLGIPLSAYQDFNAFKLFSHDVGLLAAMAQLDAKTILEGNTLFEEFKGALSEQYVMQQLNAIKYLNIFYYTSESSNSEIDFIVQLQNKVVPVEVKASENLQSKSLRFFHLKFRPERSVRTSTSDFRVDDWLTNIPLYSIMYLNKFILQNSK